MRQTFFIGILIVGVVGGIIYFLWTIGAALYEDWVMGKDVNKIKADQQQRRKERLEESRKRLDNGCEHVFGQTLGGFPLDACRKCGLQRERPAGPCDHVWKPANEPVPCSYCEKCGKRYVSPTIRDDPHSESS